MDLDTYFIVGNASGGGGGGGEMRWRKEGIRLPVCCMSWGGGRAVSSPALHTSWGACMKKSQELEVGREVFTMRPIGTPRAPAGSTHVLLGTQVPGTQFLTQSLHTPTLLDGHHYLLPPFKQLY